MNKTVEDLAAVLVAEEGFLALWVVPNAAARRETLDRVATRLTAQLPDWRVGLARGAEKISTGNGSRVEFKVADQARGLNADLLICDGPPPMAARMAVWDDGQIWDGIE